MNIRYVLRNLTGLLVGLFFIGSAQAQTHLTWDSNGNILSSTSQAQINQFNRDLTAYNQARNAGAIKTAVLSGSEVVATRAATLNLSAASGLGRAATLGMEEFVRYPLSSIGKGMVTVARATPWALVGSVALTMLADKGIQYLDNKWVKQDNGGAIVDTGGNGYDCTRAKAAGLHEGSVVYATSGGQKIIYRMYYANTGQPAGYVGVQYCTNMTYNAQGNWLTLYSYFVSSFPPGTNVDAADADIQSAVEAGLTAQPTKSLDVLKNIYDNGGWVPLDAANAAGFNIPTATVDGQATTKTSTSTAADGSTLTTTSTTTPKATVSQSGSTVSNNYLTYNITNVTSTVTKDAAGNTVSSGTSSEDKTSDAFTDSAMPGLPKLYTQKYPDGIAGVWTASKPDITNTQFYNGVKSMFPSFGGGSCPVWNLSFNLGAAGNFGSGSLTVPCWIFQALGLVILATAAFTARKILF